MRDGVKNPKAVWFIVGLIAIAMLSQFAPRFAGGAVILIVSVLAIELQAKGLI